MAFQLSQMLGADSSNYTPETLARRRKLAETMLGGAMGIQDIRHPLQGLAQMLQAGIGGYQMKQADERESSERERSAKMFAEILGQGADADMAALMGASSDPWASDANQRLAQVLMGEQLKQSDPLYQQNLERGSLEIEQMRNPEPQALINTGDGRLFDPNKGEWIVAPDGIPDDLTDTMRNLEWRAAQAGLEPGTPEYQQFMVSGGQGGTSLSVDPSTGAVTFQQGVNMKPLTEGQSKDTVYAVRAQGALPLIDQFGMALTDPVQHAMGIDPTGVVRGNQTPEFQQAYQAGQEFLQAILRKDTGAAITSQETDLYGKVYLPQPGDSPEVLLQKQKSRMRALAAIEAGLPPQAILQQEQALREVGDFPSADQATAPAAPTPPQPGTVEDGYRFKGGDPADPNSWEKVD